MSAAVGGWILIALGIVLAFTGKRLIWLAVGVTGFGLGWLFTVLLLPNIDSLARFLVGAVVGVAGALIALRGLPIIGLAMGAVLVGLFGSGELAAAAGVAPRNYSHGSFGDEGLCGALRLPARCVGVVGFLVFPAQRAIVGLCSASAVADTVHAALI